MGTLRLGRLPFFFSRSQRQGPHTCGPAVVGCN